MFLNPHGDLHLPADVSEIYNSFPIKYPHDNIKRKVAASCGSADCSAVPGNLRDIDSCSLKAATSEAGLRKGRLHLSREYTQGLQRHLPPPYLPKNEAPLQMSCSSPSPNENS